MKNFNWWFAGWQAAALALVAALTVWLQPDEPLGLLTAVSVAWVVAIICYRRSSQACQAGAYVLLAAATLIACGIVANAWYFTTASGGTDATPVMANGDAARTLDEFHMVSNIELFNRSTGYALLLWTATSPLGHFSLYIALCINMLAVLLTAVITGRFTAMVCTQTSGAAKAANLCGMLVILANCYILTTGTIVLKDAVIGLICAGYFYCCACLYMGCKKSHHTLITTAICCIIAAALIRTMTLPLLMVAPLYMLLRSHTKMMGSILVLATIVSFVCVVALPTLENYSFYTDMVVGSPSANVHYLPEFERRAPLHALIGNYETFNIAGKLMFLPAVAFCQFLIPFPWNFLRDTVFGPSLMLAHISYPAYIFGLILCYYIILRVFKGADKAYATHVGRPSSLMTADKLLVWGIIAYLAIAWIYSGCISRYCLQFVPLAAPAITLALLYDRKRRPFKLWMLGSGSMLTVVLLVCYQLQSCHLSLL